MENILRQHQKQYPLAQPQDMIKLLFQSEFGCGHFIAEEKEVTSRIKKERQSLSVIDDILPEPIGNGFYRLPLSAPLADETLASIFFLSAKKNGTFQGLKEKLQYLKTTIPVLYDETAARQALNGEIPRHSEIYRKAYRPAYRIITEEFARFIRIYYRIDALSGRKNIAIDGQAAAGKTTLGNRLFEVYQKKANLFHTDDYFLPLARKTEERLNEPGGNIDYERFRQEILDQLPSDSLTYFPFDCRTQTRKAGISVEKKEINIIEGAYSLHPFFGKAYDLRILLRINEKTQKQRIQKRNAALIAQKFFNCWIPLENRYLKECAPETDLQYEV